MRQKNREIRGQRNDSRGHISGWPGSKKPINVYFANSLRSSSAGTQLDLQEINYHREVGLKARVDRTKELMLKWEREIVYKLSWEV